MVGQRRRRWTNIAATLIQCLVFAGMDILRARNNKIYIPATCSCGPLPRSTASSRREPLECEKNKAQRVGLSVFQTLEHIIITMLLCKVKIQYLLSCKGSRYCILALRHSRVAYVCVSEARVQPVVKSNDRHERPCSEDGGDSTAIGVTLVCVARAVCGSLPLTEHRDDSNTMPTAVKTRSDLLRLFPSGAADDKTLTT